MIETLEIGNYEFLSLNDYNIHVLFSTAKGNLNFNINTDEGKSNLSKVKDWFKLKDVGYLSQIHSTNIYSYDGVVRQGDALITNEKNIGIGIFTADCVPIIMFDYKKQVISAVHSGWKGTLDEIAVKTVIKMQDEYNCNPEDLVVYIGPHNKGCCYEIGSDVESLFSSKDIYNNIPIVNKGKLNLEKCIVTQLKNAGVKEQNIKCIDICTFCSEDYSLHSYRKQKDMAGRMFSFVYLT